MMPIRLPTEAANDPDGKLKGVPESTGKDDTNRGRAQETPARRERGIQPPAETQTRHDRDKNDNSR